MRKLIILLILLIIFVAGCSNKIIEGDNPYLSEKEIKNYQNNKELPSSFRMK